MRWLRAAGLDRRETLSWALYDWANSAFATTVMAAVLPIYYVQVAGADLPDGLAQSYWAYTTALALLIIALLSPVLGAVADYLGAKKRFLAGFAAFGIAATAALYFIGRGDWLLASAVFIAANVGFAGANVFYDSLLPHVAGEDEIDLLSTAGFAVGYFGGGLLLVVNSWWILSPETFGIPDTDTASRLAMFSVAVWWAVFAVPIFRHVPEPPRRISEEDAKGVNPLLVGFGRLRETVAEIRQYRNVALFLVAFWLYNDGIGSVIKLGTIYGDSIGIGLRDLIGAIILIQFASVPFSLLFGRLARRIGAKTGLYLALGVFTLIAVIAFFVTEAWHFWVVAVLISTVLGGSQALSRSLYGSMIPRAMSSEFFAFFSVSAKFAGILGPLLFGLIGQATGNLRYSIVSLIVFFVVGIAVLYFVDVEEGRAVARAEDDRYHAVDG